MLSLVVFCLFGGVFLVIVIGASKWLCRREFRKAPSQWYDSTLAPFMFNFGTHAHFVTFQLVPDFPMENVTVFTWDGFYTRGKIPNILQKKLAAFRDTTKYLTFHWRLGKETFFLPISSTLLMRKSKSPQHGFEPRSLH